MSVSLRQAALTARSTKRRGVAGLEVVREHEHPGELGADDLVGETRHADHQQQIARLVVLVEVVDAEGRMIISSLATILSLLVVS